MLQPASDRHVVGRCCRQAYSVQPGHQFIDLSRREPAALGGQTRREYHTRGHGFSVQPLSVALSRLDSVPEGVTQIQNSAPAALALIGGHNASLGRAAALNGLGKHFGVAPLKVFSHLVEPAIKPRIADQSVFDHLG